MTISKEGNEGKIMVLGAKLRILRSKFIGREDELKELKRFADDAYEGKGNLVIWLFIRERWALERQDL